MKIEQGPSNAGQKKKSVDRPPSDHGRGLLDRGWKRAAAIVAGAGALWAGVERTDVGATKFRSADPRADDVPAEVSAKEPLKRQTVEQLSQLARLIQNGPKEEVVAELTPEEREQKIRDSEQNFQNYLAAVHEDLEYNPTEDPHDHHFMILKNFKLIGEVEHTSDGIIARPDSRSFVSFKGDESNYDEIMANLGKVERIREEAIEYVRKAGQAHSAVALQKRLGERLREEGIPFDEKLFEEKMQEAIKSDMNRGKDAGAPDANIGETGEVPQED
jgi:hypothetical protein